MYRTTADPVHCGPSDPRAGGARCRLIACLLGCLLLLILRPVLLQSAHATPHAALIDIEGPIGPATSDYVKRALARSQDEGAQLAVLRMDTPGGLDGAMRDIVKAILASPVPVAVYVSPAGSRAASAGTYILYAAHIAAMAPATSVGAATPVQLLGGPGPPDGDDRAGPQQGGQDNRAGQDKRDGNKAAAGTGSAQGSAAGPRTAMERKVINDAVSYLRGLAEQRGRNVQWAERAVREGASLPAGEALSAHVIDFVATDLDALLRQLDGRTVQTASGAVRLATAGIEVRRIEPDWRTRFLAVVAQPTFAVILLMIGLYGLLFEGLNPGTLLPGVVGGVCLLVALFALQAMPVSYAGAGLILLGIVLVIVEGIMPGFGAAGFGGIAALCLGAILLIDGDVPGFGVNRGLIAGVALGSAAVLAWILVVVDRSRRRVRLRGSVGLAGAVAQVTRFAGGEGWARLGSEYWRIRSAASLRPGERVRVLAAEGLTLRVAPESPSHAASPAAGGHHPA